MTLDKLDDRLVDQLRARVEKLEKLLKSHEETESGRIAELESERDGLSAELDRLEKRFEATDRQRDKAEARLKTAETCMHESQEWSAAAKALLKEWVKIDDLGDDRESEYPVLMAGIRKKIDNFLSQSPDLPRPDLEAARRLAKHHSYCWSGEAEHELYDLAQRFLKSIGDKP